MTFTPSDRQDAIMLIMDAFETAAPQRVNTPPEVTIAEGVLALRALGVTRDELRGTLRAMGRDS